MEAETGSVCQTKNKVPTYAHPEDLMLLSALLCPVI